MNGRQTFLRTFMSETILTLQLHLIGRLVAIRTLKNMASCLPADKKSEVKIIFFFCGLPHVPMCVPMCMCFHFYKHLESSFYPWHSELLSGWKWVWVFYHHSLLALHKAFKQRLVPFNLRKFLSVFSSFSSHFFYSLFWKFYLNHCWTFCITSPYLLRFFLFFALCFSRRFLTLSSDPFSEFF